jgi:hypothetical protein
MRAALIFSTLLLGCTGRGIDPRSYSNTIGACAASYGVTFGGSDEDRLVAQAYAPDGTLLVLGRYLGSFEVPRIRSEAELPTLTTPETFLLKLTPQGEVVWSQHFGATVTGTALVVDDKGGVFVGGTATGPYDLGAGKQGGDTEGFVLKVDAEGKYLWSQRLPEIEPNLSNKLRPAVHRLAVDASGNVILFGTFGASVRVDSETVQGLGPLNLLLAKLKPDGQRSWTRRFETRIATADLLGKPSLAVDANGAVSLVGLYDGPLSLGGNPLVTGSRDLFWARFDADGSHIASEGFAVDGSVEPSAIAGWPDGSSTVTGAFRGTIAGTSLGSQGQERDILWLHLGPHGELLESARLGGKGADAAYGLTLSADEAWISGWVSGVAEIGSTSIGQPDQATGFVARLSEAGEVHQVVSFQGPANSAGYAIHALAGCLAVSGSYHGGELLISDTRVGISDAPTRSRDFIAQLKLEPVRF